MAMTILQLRDIVTDKEGWEITSKIFMYVVIVVTDLRILSKCPWLQSV